MLPLFPICTCSPGGLWAPGRDGAPHIEGSGAACGGSFTLQWVAGCVSEMQRHGSKGGPRGGAESQAVNPEG